MSIDFTLNTVDTIIVKVLLIVHNFIYRDRIIRGTLEITGQTVERRTPTSDEGREKEECRKYKGVGGRMETDMTLSEFPAFADNNARRPSSRAMRYIEKRIVYLRYILFLRNTLLNDIIQDKSYCYKYIYIYTLKKFRR